jgi:hypothetical protein
LLIDGLADGELLGDGVSPTQKLAAEEELEAATRIPLVDSSSVQDVSLIYEPGAVTPV